MSVKLVRSSGAFRRLLLFALQWLSVVVRARGAEMFAVPRLPCAPEADPSCHHRGQEMISPMIQGRL